MKRSILSIAVAASIALALGACGGGPTTGTVAPTSASETRKPPPAAGRTPLLGGRLTVALPAEARVAPRRRSIMAAEESDEEETRVILAPGAGDLARFVMLARETFVTGTGDAPADARLWLRESGERARVEPIAAGEGLSVAAIVPQTAARGDAPLLVLALLVERPDKTIAEVGFYILPEMAGERAKWDARARAVAGSLAAGQNALVATRDHRVDVGGGRALALRSPEPFVLTRQPGPDFLVFRIRSLRPIGRPPSAIGVYVGGHPSYQFEQAGIAPADVQKISGKLLGNDVEWMRWTEEDVVMLEAMTRVGEHDVVHVFLYAEPARLDALKAAAEGMTLLGP